MLYYKVMNHIINILFSLALTLCTVLEASDSSLLIGEHKHFQVLMPPQPPATFSLAIEPREPVQSLHQWPIHYHSDAYDALRKIVELWDSSQGIKDYMVYSKLDSSAKFQWQVIGYPQQSLGPWQQASVVWHLLRQTSAITTAEQQTLIKKYRVAWPTISLEAPSPSTDQGIDAFCNVEVIAKQRIFSGNHIDILYNYAPLAPGEAALHFLVIPKMHRTTFLELNREEFIEASILTDHITHYFLTHGYQTAHIFHKNGVEAGQSVPHWHQHLVFTASSNEDYLFLFNLIKNALWGPTPISEQELAERVHEYSALFQTILRGEQNEPFRK
jgi:diadenosine tetraphosphate (Ap4A) HIT family hydrolase